MCVTMTIEGPAGRAARLDLKRQVFAANRSTVDLWTVNLYTARAVIAADGKARRRTQFGILVAARPPGGDDVLWYRTSERSTHILLFAPLAHPWAPTMLPDGIVPELAMAESVARVEFVVPDDYAARAVGRGAAVCTVGAVLPMVGRAAVAAWHHAVQMTAVALSHPARDRMDTWVNPSRK